MLNQPPSLGETVVLIYELEGMSGVQLYAKETAIPIKFCLNILADYFKRRLEADFKDQGKKQPLRLTYTDIPTDPLLSEL
jgi:hypothetical protein